LKWYCIQLAYMKKYVLILFLKGNLFTVGFSQTGKIGINTTTPQAMLHVKDSSVLFSGGLSLPGSPGNPPASGAGIRMMWYPGKAAFRAGMVDDNYWDAFRIGNYSFASGFNTVADGALSTAMGYRSFASGSTSFAVGYQTQATGSSSIAMGENSIASGNLTSAIGVGATALGNASTAIGEYTNAQGNSSLAAGSFTYATGHYSTALGNYTEARAYASTTIGKHNDPISSSSQNAWISTDPIFIIGNSNTGNPRSNALVVLKNAKTGINTSYPQAMLHVKDSSVLFSGGTDIPPVPGNPPASGSGIRMMWYPDKGAFRVGRAVSNYWDKDNIGNYSFASGISTQASGNYSTAMGYSASASGNYSTAIGYSANSFGLHSMGLGNHASGEGESAIAVGVDATAVGKNSVAIGWRAETKAFASIAIGANNIPFGGSETVWQSNDPLFIIGNSDNESVLSNAMMVLKNGNTAIGSFKPDYKLDVGDRMRLRGGGTLASSAGIWLNNVENTGQVGFLGVYNNEMIGWYGTGGSSWNLMMNVNTGFVGIGTVSPSQKLHVVGNICYTGSIAACSDIRYKKNISSINNALNSVLKLKGIYYDWEKEKFKDKGFTDDRQLGFSAQEVEKLFPQIVLTDQHGYKSVDYGRLTPVLVEAVKEQQQQISEQQEQIKNQQQQIDELRKIIMQKIKQ
jgi:Chaperone of endosialidase/Head domain of trimeric autotransporter adhesin